jgi:hypothetical protein
MSVKREGALQGEKQGALSEGIPDALVRFIAEHVSSLEELEVVFLLRATAPRAWRPDEVSRELGSSLMSIRTRLDHLASMQILVVEATEAGTVYRYAPEDEQVAALLDGLARLYKERRLAVIDLVYGRPESDIRAFSEAFRIKKK